MRSAKLATGTPTVETEIVQVLVADSGLIQSLLSRTSCNRITPTWSWLRATSSRI